MMKTRFAIAFFLLMALALTGCGKKPSTDGYFTDNQTYVPSEQSADTSDMDDQPFHCFSDEYADNFRAVQPDYEGPDAVFFMIQIENYDDYDSLLEDNLYYGYIRVENTTDTTYYWGYGYELTPSDSVPIEVELPDGQYGWRYVPSDTMVLLNEYGDIVEKKDALAYTGYYAVFDGQKYFLTQDEFGVYEADYRFFYGNGGYSRHVNIMGFPKSEE